MEFGDLGELISPYIYEYYSDQRVLGISESSIEIYKLSEIPASMECVYYISPDLDWFSKDFIESCLESEDTKTRKKALKYVFTDKFLRVVKSSVKNKFLDPSFLKSLSRFCKSKQKNSDSNVSVEELDIIPLVMRLISKMEKDYLRNSSK